MHRITSTVTCIRKACPGKQRLLTNPASLQALRDELWLHSFVLEEPVPPFPILLDHHFVATLYGKAALKGMLLHNVDSTAPASSASQSIDCHLLLGSLAATHIRASIRIQSTLLENLGAIRGCCVMLFLPGMKSEEII